MAADLAFLTRLHGPRHNAIPCANTRYRSRTEEVRPILQALCRRYPPGRTPPRLQHRLATVHQRVQRGLSSGARPATHRIRPARWRAVNAPDLVFLVRAGAKFENGKLVERPDESGGDQQAA